MWGMPRGAFHGKSFSTDRACLSDAVARGSCRTLHQTSHAESVVSYLSWTARLAIEKKPRRRNAWKTQASAPSVIPIITDCDNSPGSRQSGISTFRTLPGVLFPHFPTKSRTPVFHAPRPHWMRFQPRLWRKWIIISPSRDRTCRTFAAPPPYQLCRYGVKVLPTSGTPWQIDEIMSILSTSSRQLWT